MPVDSRIADEMTATVREYLETVARMRGGSSWKRIVLDHAEIQVVQVELVPEAIKGDAQECFANAFRLSQRPGYTHA